MSSSAAWAGSATPCLRASRTDERRSRRLGTGWPVAGNPILVVDDNPANRRLAQAVLEAAGHEVHDVADAEEALTAVASLHPALILMDIQLPGLDGLEL